MLKKSWAKILVIFLILVNVGLIALNTTWSQGDELHYLLVSASLIQDGDLEVKNNYENKDYFVHHAHSENPHVVVSDSDEWWPGHGILTSVIIAPAYGASLFIKNTFGFDSNRVVLFLPRLTILILHIIFCFVLVKYLQSLGFSKKISLLTVAIYSIQLPIIIYAQSIYPDLMASYFVMTGVFLGLIFAKNSEHKWLILASVFFGLSIFLHSKLVILTAGLIFSLICYFQFVLYGARLSNIKSWFDFRSKTFWQILASLILPWLMFFLANVLLKFDWLGQFAFDGFGKLGSSGNRSVLDVLNNPLQGWLGQWLDIEMGLLWSAPVLFLIFPGLIVWFKRQRSTFLLVVPVMLAYLLLNSSYYDWSAGFSPVSRYVIVSLSLFLPALAWVLQSARGVNWLKVLIGVLVFFSLLLSSLIPFVGQRGLPYYEGYNVYWRTILNFLDLNFLEPVFALNFFQPGLWDYTAGIGIFVLLIGLGVYLSQDKFLDYTSVSVVDKNLS